MFLTQDQARTKWCPYVKVAFGGGTGSANRIWQKFKSWAQGKDREFMQEQEDACRCIAADCMVWRWLMINQHGSGATIESNGSLTWVRGTRLAEPPDDARGYCGAAPVAR